MSDEKYLKQLADLLKSGAKMLGDHCPECNSPLFTIQGEIRCPRCNKRVVKVKMGEELSISTSFQLNDIERTILIKIQEVNKLIIEEKDLTNLEKLSNLLIKWLETLEKVRKIQKS
jgi:UPF0148 protein